MVNVGKVAMLSFDVFDFLCPLDSA